MGADIEIVKRGDVAFLFECKYGSAAYIKRNGFHQISTYAAEVQQAIAPAAEGFIIGPDDVVTNEANTLLGGTRLRVAAPRHLRDFAPMT